MTKTELIIEQLKANKRQLILMNPELRDAMLHMRHADFLCLQNTSVIDNLQWTSVVGDEWTVDANLHNTFRLRADYKDEPEIVEIEITLDPESNIYGYKCPCSDDPVNADSAHSCPGFRLIGFKFEDGMLRTTSIYYQRPTYANPQVRLDEEYKVLDATHVVFRRQK